MKAGIPMLKVTAPALSKSLGTKIQTASAAYPPYAEYQERTTRRIPVFIAERS
jgi:hypothetical protein